MSTDPLLSTPLMVSVALHASLLLGFASFVENIQNSNAPMFEVTQVALLPNTVNTNKVKPSAALPSMRTAQAPMVQAPVVQTQATATAAPSASVATAPVVVSDAVQAQVPLNASMSSTASATLQKPTAVATVASPSAGLPPALVAVAPTAVAVTDPVVQAPISSAAYLNNPPPQYPAQSRRLGERGTVKWRVLIGTDGKASEPELFQSSGFARLDEAARQAVLAWRYVPGKRGGAAEAMRYVIPLTFE